MRYSIDRYANAPVMQVTQHSFILDMIDKRALLSIMSDIQLGYVVYEVEAIATSALVEGCQVAPNARVIQLIMDREEIQYCK